MFQQNGTSFHHSVSQVLSKVLRAKPKHALYPFPKWEDIPKVLKCEPSWQCKDILNPYTIGMKKTRVVSEQFLSQLVVYLFRMRCYVSDEGSSERSPGVGRL